MNQRIASAWLGGLFAIAFLPLSAWAVDCAALRILLAQEADIQAVDRATHTRSDLLLTDDWQSQLPAGLLYATEHKLRAFHQVGGVFIAQGAEIQTSFSLRYTLSGQPVIRLHRSLQGNPRLTATTLVHALERFTQLENWLRKEARSLHSDSPELLSAYRAVLAKRLEESTDPAVLEQALRGGSELENQVIDHLFNQDHPNFEEDFARAPTLRVRLKLSLEQMRHLRQRFQNEAFPILESLAQLVEHPYLDPNLRDARLQLQMRDLLKLIRLHPGVLPPEGYLSKAQLQSAWEQLSGRVTSRLSAEQKNTLESWYFRELGFHYRDRLHTDAKEHITQLFQIYGQSARAYR